VSYYLKMSDGTCVHVNAQEGPFTYHAFVREYGGRKYRHISKHRSERAAYRSMVDAFITNRRIKRGVVTRAEAFPSYYDPIPLCELKR
jgi:hypothetical protein